jgi:glycosyltransferase involved in cell wall biosynthesis
MAACMKVRLIGKANGVGLSRDFELLAAALHEGGCEVTLHGCERRDRKRRRGIFTRLAARARGLRGARPDAPYDVNLMLEHVWPQFLHEATRNVLVPNPEWFDRRDVAFLGAVQRVWAKTALAERLFVARGCRAVRIGFDSADRYDPTVMREAKFLHLAGRSPLKGTARLHALWQRHPEWPLLTIVQDAEAVTNPTRGAELPGAEGAGNIRVERRFLSDEQIRTLQNSHRFHLCTSEAEGWGHYIVEAMSVGAVTLTCDAPPMNELIGPKRGVLLAVHMGERHNLASLSLFDEAALEAAVTRLLALSSAACETIGAAARAWYLDNKQGFFARVRHALDELRT